MTKFIPLRNIVAERNYIEGIGPHAYPIAHAECGNYVFLDQEQAGAIFFWDHEIQDGVYKIAGNLDQFLNELTPAEPIDFSNIKRSGHIVSMDLEFMKQHSVLFKDKDGGE